MSICSHFIFTFQVKAKFKSYTNNVESDAGTLTPCIGHLSGTVLEVTCGRSRNSVIGYFQNVAMEIAVYKMSR